MFVGEVTVDAEALCVTAGLMFKNDLKPTYEMHVLSETELAWDNSVLRTFATTSPTSLKSAHRPMLLFARKSSMRRVPIL